MSAAAGELYTIGHSNHAPEHFLDLLRRHGIEVVVDVRSHPYARFATHFDGPALRLRLMEAGFSYLYLGRELGGRPADPAHYDDAGHARYDLMAQAPAFLAGIERLERGLRRYRVAIMCSEEDPAGCHRRLLVGRVLAQRGVTVTHIRGDGRLQAEAELPDPRQLGKSGAAARRGEGAQLSLFPELEEPEWKSIRSVSRSARRPTSSER